MIKFLKELYRDFEASQQEMAKMGIWNFPIHSGFWCYMDHETFQEYLKKKEQENESN